MRRVFYRALDDSRLDNFFYRVLLGFYNRFICKQLK